MNNLETKYIYSSGLMVSKNPVLYNTVLGSCVSVCFWDTKKFAGGMNHYMLPLWNGNGLASPKYGNIAIEQLLNKMYRIGCEKQNLIAKIFGGAMMLNEQSQVYNIGTRNVELAKSMLEKENIRIVAQSTGGIKGRKIFFNTFSGEVLQKML